jgi:hypothetical protein
MGMRSDEGGASGYDVVKLKKAQEEAALLIEVEGQPDDWLIGMTPDVAEANLRAHGFRFRVFSRQGAQDFMTTADWSMTRFNVNLDADGKIDEVLGRG